MTAAAQPVCEITPDGYLRLPGALAERYFPAGVCVATVADGDLVLLPLRSAANGGLVLKQRNVAGDRSLLISEVLAFQPPAGRFRVTWDHGRGALIVALTDRPGEGVSDEPDRADGGRRGLPAVDRLPAADRSGGRLAPQAVRAPDRTRSADHGVDGAAGGAPASAAATGRRLARRVAS
jgi:hypothetical protein